MTTAATAATMNWPLLFSSLFRLTKLTATMKPSVPRTRIGGKSRPGSLTLCIVIELVSATVGK